MKSATYRSHNSFFIWIICIATSLVGAVALCAFLVPKNEDQIRLLRSELAQKIAESDFDGAVEKLKALEALLPEKSDVAFQRAVIEYERGNRETARKIIKQLVDKGHSEASLWELEHEAYKDFKDWDEEKRDRFDGLVTLASASKYASTALRSKAILAAYHLYHHRLENALEALHEASLLDPASGLNAASLATKLGQPERALGYLRRAKFHFSLAVSKHPLDVESRLQLARALIQLGEERDAVFHLSEGFELTKHPCFQQAAGEAMVVWSSRIEREQSLEETATARLILVHRASQCAPNDQAVLNALANIVDEFREKSNLYTPKLRSLMASGFEHESAHFMLGILALLEGDVQKASLHCDLAELAGTHLATVLNNLALLALQHKNISAEDGLRLVNGALQRLPGQPHFSETRGRIHLAMDHYKEAIDDLKNAAVIDELKPTVYANLSNAYRKLGQKSTALHYEKLRQNLNP